QRQMCLRDWVNSDLGAHYGSRIWIRRNEAANIIRSMSKKGYSPDNAACEGCFGRLKNEMYYGRRWTSADELETTINAYIKFYNTTRIKVSLGGYSINQYRALNQLEPKLS
ncbi:MAG: IS3 family transposase, partial [Yaniella sp.]|nr:IS3 family transposase [Yaniella sp.]